MYSYIHQVGMATNIPPHNLGEVVDVLRVMIHNPEATVSAKSYSLFLSNGNPLKTQRQPDAPQR